MMKKTYIGIDPGKLGFITVLNDNNSMEHFAMPLLNKDEINVFGLYGLVSELKKRFGENVICGIEEVHAIFGASAGSTFNFGYNVGVIHGVFASTGWPILRIQPKSWQKEMWSDIPPVRKKSMSGKTLVTDTKATSIKACKTLFPNIDLRRTDQCKKDDDNKCDSILIANYLKRKGY